LVATVLQYSGWRPLGLWPGVWSGMVAVVLFIAVSLLTAAPEKKAEDFLNYLRSELDKRNVI